MCWCGEMLPARTPLSAAVDGVWHGWKKRAGVARPKRPTDRTDGRRGGHRLGRTEAQRGKASACMALGQVAGGAEESDGGVTVGRRRFSATVAATPRRCQDSAPRRERSGESEKPPDAPDGSECVPLSIRAIYAPLSFGSPDRCSLTSRQPTHSGCVTFLVREHLCCARASNRAGGCVCVTVCVCVLVQVCVPTRTNKCGKGQELTRG